MLEPATAAQQAQDALFGPPSARSSIETTAGRVCFNEIWPEGLGFINTTIGKIKDGQDEIHSDIKVLLDRKR